MIIDLEVIEYCSETNLKYLDPQVFLFWAFFKCSFFFRNKKKLYVRHLALYIYTYIALSHLILESTIYFSVRAGVLKVKHSAKDNY